jgi:hypothetical protein
MTNPDWLTAARRADVSFDGQVALSDVGNVFFYEGTAFLLVWGGLAPFVKEISSSPGPGDSEYVGSRAVCVFDYQPNQFK